MEGHSLPWAVSDPSPERNWVNSQSFFFFSFFFFDYSFSLHYHLILLCCQSLFVTSIFLTFFFNLISMQIIKKKIKLWINQKLWIIIILNLCNRICKNYPKHSLTCTTWIVVCFLNTASLGDEWWFSCWFVYVLCSF